MFLSEPRDRRDLARLRGLQGGNRLLFDRCVHRSGNRQAFATDDAFRLETDRGRRRPLRPLPTRLPRHRRGGAEGRRQRVAAAAMNGSQEAKPPSLGEFIGAAAFLLGLISAWLYAAGWAYAYHYFDRFGIPLLMVDIPKENYPIYGGVVV